MKYTTRILSLLITLSFLCSVEAQNNSFSTRSDSDHNNVASSLSNGNYTTMPIALPMSLAGCFAEIRPNHFHSGLDLRTNGKEGEKVYAPNDGYVSRINISAWGGGKVLYITHPDGYRTVYMHLSQFCGDIGRFVEDYQYNNHVYAFDIDLPKDSIKVKKGQLVALTGNTGGSAGPHLHYEIRLAENDQTINPLYFGLPYSDPVAPTIAGIKIYPANKQSTINGKNSELKVFPESKGGNDITVAGRFYTGIYTYDQMESGSRNKNGIERIELFVDGELFHRYQVPTFMFEETRTVNALIDYAQYQRNREYYILSRHLRGDRNNFNIAFKNNGYIEFFDNNKHKIEYRVSDYKGNTTSRSFFVISDTSAKLTNSSDNLRSNGTPIVYFKRFHLDREGFSLDIEPYNIYDNDELIYRTTTASNVITPVHWTGLRNNALPPHQSINVALAIPGSIPASMRDKLTIVCINGKNKSACPTKEDNGWLKATSRTFGGFAICIDTTAPSINAVNFSEGKPFKANIIIVKIGDNLSGIANYNCYINGEWQVAEHDGKTSSLYVSANSLHKGSNTISFTLTDAVGNTTEKTWKILKP